MQSTCEQSMHYEHPPTTSSFPRTELFKTTYMCTIMSQLHSNQQKPAQNHADGSLLCLVLLLLSELFFNKSKWFQSENVCRLTNMLTILINLPLWLSSFSIECPFGYLVVQKKTKKKQMICEHKYVVSVTLTISYNKTQINTLLCQLHCDFNMYHWWKTAFPYQPQISSMHN